jgi:hypothetical protein
MFFLNTLSDLIDCFVPFGPDLQVVALLLSELLLNLCVQLRQLSLSALPERSDCLESQPLLSLDAILQRDSLFLDHVD